MSVLVLAAFVGSALADEPSPVPDNASPGPDVPAAVVAAPSTVSAEDLRAIRAENAALREELELLREDHEVLERKVDALAPLAAKLTGYVDIGFFTVSGDGSGIRRDVGHRYFPEYAGLVPDSWTFMGDPLSTAVNSRGDPATTGESRAITFDAIEGRTSTFLVNTLNLGLFAPFGSHGVFTASLDVLPRSRDVSEPDGTSLGDYVDLRLAYVEYRMAWKAMRLDLFAGKFDSVLGFEYRSQEAPARIEVTPSLICRYTCGYPIGLKARARWFDDALVLNLAVTNGSHSSEGFPFHDETDSNQVKSVAARLSLRLGAGVEVGVSGLVGAQDRQSSDSVVQWQYGVDAHYHRQDFVLRGELVQGRASGRDDPADMARCGLAPCLSFKGAYALAGYRVTNIVMPYVRVDWRDALHQSGMSFAYISKLYRVTPGVHLTINEWVIVKAEYTLNRELGRIPQFPNDVFTTSLVIKY
ncbi:MAG: hypothetical protein HOV81_18060 [Kofleriaceae bacterium]|nr:hypothetical protein [Kofleriaceae bacterium]